jgi:N-acetylglucosaminyl-diphospho-decaprenol L-rhamnosyltransferase
MSKLQIIIPYWNTPDSLKERISDLSDDFPVCIVNNDSVLPSLPKSSHITVINNSRNDGFARACNLGWQSTSAAFVLFLNADCQISAADIEVLLQEMKERNFGAISPQFVTPTGEAQAGYHQSLPSLWSILYQYSPLRHLPKLAAGNQTLPGGCLLVRRSVLEELSGWDERFWLWWEDSDFSQRLLEHGQPFGVSTMIKVQHEGGESFSSLTEDWKKQVFFHSLRVYSRKHFGSVSHRIVHLITNRWITSPLYPQDKKINVSIVVPNVRLSQLEEFLKHNYQYFSFESEELICVTSAKVSALKELYPEVIFITFDRPAGFAATVNIGLCRARGRYIGTVNDDVILQSGFDQAISAFEKMTGTVQPLVMNPGEVVESYGVSIQPRGKAEANKEPVTTSDTINAAAVVFSRDALESAGFFDEKFGSYLEDIDLGLRMKQAGFEHKVLSDWLVVHLGQQTSKAWPVRKAWQDTKNWWLIVLKPYWWKYWPAHGIAILIERLRNANGLRKVWSSRGRK